MSDLASKRCNQCGEVKPLSEFRRVKRSSDARRTQCRACCTVSSRRYRAADPEAAVRANRKGKRAAWKRDREAVFAHYGTSCACCGDTENLTIDHVNGGGNAHRRELSGRDAAGGGGVLFYRWLVKQGFPAGYQTMCRRCNRSKSDGEHCILRHSP